MPDAVDPSSQERSMPDPVAALTDTVEAPAEPEPAGEREEPLVEVELLVEDVSIDGMCGVY
jgi:mycofactocin precursor